MSLIDQPAILERLRVFVGNAGTQKEAARRLNVTEQFLSDVLRGRRAPTGPVLKGLHYEAVTLYRPIPEARNA